MKKALAGIVVFSMTASLIACDVKSIPSETSATVEPSVSATETTVETTESTTAVTTTVPEETVETVVRTQESIDIAWEARLDYESGDSNEIPIILINNEYEDLSGCDGTGFVIHSDISISGETFTSLSESINRFCSEMNENTSLNVDEPYCSFLLRRCDNRVVSVIYRYIGDDYNPVYIGHTYTTDGELLNFDDVVKDRNTFAECVSDVIRESLEQPTYSTTKYFDEIGDSQWFMDANNLVLVIGSELVYIPYRDYADLLNPEYLPGMGKMLASFTIGSIVCGEFTLFSDNYDDGDIMAYDFGLRTSIEKYDDSHLIDDGMVYVMLYADGNGNYYTWLMGADTWDDTYRPFTGFYNITDGRFEVIFERESCGNYTYFYPGSCVSDYSELDSMISTDIENGTFVTIDGNSGNNTNMVTTSSRKHLDSSFLVGIVDIHSV